MPEITESVEPTGENQELAKAPGPESEPILLESKLNAEQSMTHTVSRIVTKELAHPVVIAGSMVSWVAYRDDAPSIQSYGTDPQTAKVAFLRDEQHRPKSGPEQGPAAK